MNYKDFKEIAEYLNYINHNTFSAREVEENAGIYLADFEWSKENDDIAYNIKELAKLLAEDGTEEAKEWLYQMATELELLDMDYLDYTETDADIVSMFLADKPRETEIISSIIFKHGEDDYSIWNGFALSKEDNNAIQKILQKYTTDGCSVRGTQKEITRELQGN